MDDRKADTGFWSVVDRFKTLLQLIAALIAVASTLLVLVEPGFAATVPAWGALLLTAVGVVLGYLLGRRPQPAEPGVIPCTRPSESKICLETIDLRDQEAPLKCGWVLSQTTGQNQPALTQVSDGLFMNALKVTAAGSYALDYAVKPSAHIGNLVEFAVKLGRDSAVYAKLEIESKSGPVPKGPVEVRWFQFRVGRTLPEPLDTNEWIVYVEPESLGNGWCKFQIDLNDSFAGTFGQEWWVLKKLQGFRLRGDLTIAYIKVYK